MRPIGTHNYFVYILTNKYKTVLYTGVTNDLRSRLYQHTQDALGKEETFAGKYKCIYLIFWERHEYIDHAIEREKEIKGWTRDKKIKLIAGMNPTGRFLNDDVEDEI
jgi:putative endonuclease